jgi:hypothetical protein
MLNSTKAEAEEGVEMALAKPGAGAGAAAADFKFTTGNLDNDIIDHFSFGEDEEVEIEMPSDVDHESNANATNSTTFPNDTSGSGGNKLLGLSGRFAVAVLLISGAYGVGKLANRNIAYAIEDNKALARGNRRPKTTKGPTARSTKAKSTKSSGDGGGGEPCLWKLEKYCQVDCTSCFQSAFTFSKCPTDLANAVGEEIGNYVSSGSPFVLTKYVSQTDIYTGPVGSTGQGIQLLISADGLNVTMPITGNKWTPSACD